MTTAHRLAPVAVALDTSDRTTFETWCRVFGPRVGVLKVGLQAFVRWGPAAVESAGATGAEVFLDLKLHDIPNTVTGAVQSARDLGARYLTVHAGGGPAMLRAAVEAAEDRMVVLAVTLLTHLDAEELEALELPGTPEERVAAWAELAAVEGCGGVVCSPREARLLRTVYPRPFLLVTPGVRPAGAAAADQRRIATPHEALEAGADLLVIGRPLTGAADPEQALTALAVELAR